MPSAAAAAKTQARWYRHSGQAFSSIPSVSHRLPSDATRAASRAAQTATDVSAVLLSAGFGELIGFLAAAGWFADYPIPAASPSRGYSLSRKRLSFHRV